MDYNSIHFQNAARIASQAWDRRDDRLLRLARSILYRAWREAPHTNRIRAMYGVIRRLIDQGPSHSLTVPVTHNLSQDFEAEAGEGTLMLSDVQDTGIIII